MAAQIEALQRALYRWLPCEQGAKSQFDETIREDAMLLVGYENFEANPEIGSGLCRYIDELLAARRLKDKALRKARALLRVDRQAFIDGNVNIRTRKFDHAEDRKIMADYDAALAAIKLALAAKP